MLHGHGIGTVLNETYRLERELGRSSLGTVYAGSNLARGTECAIRLFPPEARDLIVERERFLRDHKVVAQIGDPRVPAVDDMSITQDGALFLVTELWRGETLRQRLRRGVPPLRSVFSLLVTICEPLARLHQRGVPHGDISPGNVVLGKGAETPEGKSVQIVDLGLHHFRVGPLRVFTRRAPGVGWYVAPEQVESRMREADPRGDVFALGAMLYEALTGRPAFLEPPASNAMRERSGLAQLSKNGAGGRALVPELEQLLSTACAVDPAERFADAQAMLEALRALEGALPTAEEAEGPREEGPGAGDAPQSSSKRSRRKPLLGGAAPEGAVAESDSQPNSAPAAALPVSEPPPAASPVSAASPTAAPPPAEPPAPAPSPGPAAATPVPASAADKPLSPVAARLQALGRGELRPPSGPRPARAVPARVIPKAAKPERSGEQEPTPSAPSTSTPAEPAPSSQTLAPPPAPSLAGPPAAAEAGVPAETAPAPSQGTPQDAAEKAADAAKAIAAARRAAAARLLEAARARARKSGPGEGGTPASASSPAVQPESQPSSASPAAGEVPTAPGPSPAPAAVPQPVALTPSARRRRAPADLKEQPPAAGEVIAQPKEMPPLDSGQIIVDLPEVPAQVPAEVSSAASPAVSAVSPSQSPAEVPARHGHKPHRPPPLPAELSQPAIPASAMPLTVPTPVVAPSPAAPDRAVTAPLHMASGLPGQLGAAAQRTAEVELVPLPVQRSTWSLMWASLIGGVLVFGAGYLALQLLSSPAQKEVVAQRPAAPVPAPPADDLPQRLADIDRALASDDFTTARQLAEAALSAHPGDAPVQERVDKADAELKNQARYEGFRSAVDHHNNEAALALYAELPDTSVYHAKASQEADAVRGEYIAGRMTQAKAAQRLRLCDEVHRQVRAILAVDPDNEAAKDLDGRCGQAPAPRDRETAAQEPRAPRQKQKRGADQASVEERPSSLKDLRDPFK